MERLLPAGRISSVGTALNFEPIHSARSLARRSTSTLRSENAWLAKLALFVAASMAVPWPLSIVSFCTVAGRLRSHPPWPPQP
jgi:hypothetical protein